MLNEQVCGNADHAIETFVKEAGTTARRFFDSFDRNPNGVTTLVAVIGLLFIIHDLVQSDSSAKEKRQPEKPE